MTIELTRRSLIASGSAAFGLGLAGPLGAAPAPRPLDVRTREGVVSGTIENGAATWKGIPFAEPPIGPLRGRPPVPAKVRRAPLEAKAYRSMAVQMALGPMRDRLIGSEDCLYLNVWSPLANRRNLPVIVWIHGGGFIVGAGSEPLWSGDYYAAQGGVVFVTINYRVGGFGYMFNPHEAGSANLGTLDQMLALKWVRRNIAAFGGDPSNITVMGESAGGMSIGQLLGAPGGAGLFDKAIVQSGATSHFFSNGEQREIAEKVLHHAGLKPGEHEKFLKLETGAMQIAFRETFEEGGTPLIGPIAFHPGIDGVVYKQHPERTLRPVPTLIGHCKSEMAFFKTLPGSVFPGTLIKAEALAGPENWQKIKAAYTAPIQGGADADVELRSDAFCVIATERLANGLTRRGAKVWSYRFDYDKAAPFGAGHATDLRYTFYRGGAPVVAVGPGPAPKPMNLEEMRLGATIWSSMIEFARRGTPQTDILPTWPVHDPMGLAFMSIDESPQLQHDYVGAERRAAWSAVPPEKMV